MTPPPRFCSQCGAPLADGVRFCGQCGGAVAGAPAARPAAPYPAPPPPPPPPAYAPQPAPPPAYAAPAETIVGMLSLNQRKGMFGYNTFNLLVTPGRLVFVSVSSREMSDAVTQARQEAKAQGKGFFGQWGAQFAWLDVIRRGYQQMPLDAVVAQHPGSFVIPNLQVRRVRYHESRDDEGGRSIEELTIETSGGKFKFILQGSSLKQARELLRQTLGGVA